MRKFDVEVMRTGWSYKTITVEAKDEAEAKQLALQAVSDKVFCESDSDYDVVSVNELTPPKPKIHETLFPHRFNAGDEVFVRNNLNVSRQKIISVVFTMSTLSVPVVHYRYYAGGSLVTVEANCVFATAEEAFG